MLIALKPINKYIVFYQNRQICLYYFLGVCRNSRVKYTRHSTGLKALGAHIRKVRRSHGLSQEQLAFKADIELSQISRIERGVINTSVSQIFVIAEALDIHPKELFDFKFPSSS
ncbi:MAG: helix-turn-helix transcriptional regulator [Saprospiraceae bacterium]